MRGQILPARYFLQKNIKIVLTKTVSINIIIDIKNKFDKHKNKFGAYCALFRFRKMRSEKILKALADNSRLKIVAYLLSGPKFVEQIAKQLNISVSTASFHLEKLKAAGLVRDKREQYYKTYSLSENALSTRLIDLVSDGEADGREFEREVIKEYFEGDKIVRLPVQKMKRKAVLERVAQRLVKKGGYTQKELFIELSEYFEDFILLKNELINL